MSIEEFPGGETDPGDYSRWLRLEAAAGVGVAVLDALPMTLSSNNSSMYFSRSSMLSSDSRLPRGCQFCFKK